MGLKSVGRLFGKVEISRLGQFGHLPWDQFLLIGPILSDDMGILPIFKLVTFKISISILNILLNKQVQKDGDIIWEAYKLIIKSILLVHVVTAIKWLLKCKTYKMQSALKNVIAQNHLSSLGSNALH